MLVDFPAGARHQSRNHALLHLHDDIPRAVTLLLYRKTEEDAVGDMAAQKEEGRGDRPAHGEGERGHERRCWHVGLAVHVVLASLVAEDVGELADEEGHQGSHSRGRAEARELDEPGGAVPRHEVDGRLLHEGQRDVRGLQETTSVDGNVKICVGGEVLQPPVVNGIEAALEAGADASHQGVPHVVLCDEVVKRAQDHPWYPQDAEE
mmetsp:Transcript_69147/g.195930  ORF Transcript_69147/g.195930 Transcript_69147/m.195930 type:complete len:207 (-) Transcript_69147:878-1498(-)